MTMNLNIEETDQIYHELKSSKLSLRELVVLGLQTSRMIVLQEEEKDFTKEIEPDWKVLNEIQNIKLMLGGSANKGKAAEESILVNLSKFFPHIEIDATGYKSGKGDIVMNLGDIKIMIEVKNYSNNVPTKEQDKFHRDLINNNYKAAIMVSCNSGIAGHTSQFDYSNIGNKFAVYLSNSGNDALSVMWAVLFIKSSLGLVNKISQENKNDQKLIKTYVENKLKIIKDCVEDHMKMRDNIFSMKSAIMRTLENSVEHMIQSMNISKNRLQSLIENFNEILDSGNLSAGLDILYSDVKVAKTLEEYTLKELRVYAKDLGVNKISKMAKPDLLKSIHFAKCQV